ncbi:MAG: peptidase S1, partial [Actinobacteria bacterium]|nr:peptidase S1 [Actinomycetota bacterium]
MRRGSIFKVTTGFVIGVSVASGFAIANNPSVPIVKACVDNKSKALFISSNGSCPKG